jgi:hypothetical protein
MTAHITHTLNTLLPAMKDGFIINTLKGAFHINGSESKPFATLAADTLMQRISPTAADKPNQPFAKLFNTRKGQIVAMLLPCEKHGCPTIQLFIQPQQFGVMQHGTIHVANKNTWEAAIEVFQLMDERLVLEMCQPLFDKQGGVQ